MKTIAPKLDDRQWTPKTGTDYRQRILAEHKDRALMASAEAAHDEIAFIADSSDIAAHNFRDAIGGETLAKYTGVVVGTVKVDTAAGFLAKFNSSWNPGDEADLVSIIEGISAGGFVPVFVLGGGGSMVAMVQPLEPPLADAWKSVS